MYYDYDFSKMLDELETMNSTNTDILTELRTMHNEQKEYYSDVNSGITFLSIFLVVSIAVKVMFK